MHPQRDVPHQVVPWSAVTAGELAEGCCYSGTGWASVRSWWAVALFITCFVISFIIITFIIIIFPSVSILVNCLYLSPQVLHYFDSLPPSHWGGQWAVWCRAACWVKPQQRVKYISHYEVDSGFFRGKHLYSKYNVTCLVPDYFISYFFCSTISFSFLLKFVENQIVDYRQLSNSLQFFFCLVFYFIFSVGM